LPPQELAHFCPGGKRRVHGNYSRSVFFLVGCASRRAFFAGLCSKKRANSTPSVLRARQSPPDSGQARPPASPPPPRGPSAENATALFRRHGLNSGPKQQTRPAPSPAPIGRNSGATVNLPKPSPHRRIERNSRVFPSLVLPRETRARNPPRWGYPLRRLLPVPWLIGLAQTGVGPAIHQHKSHGRNSSGFFSHFPR